MAKKDRPKSAQADEVKDTPEVEATPEVAAEAPEAAAPAAPKAAAQDAPLVDLGTYARLAVEGYKEHWWVSIERYAREHGLKSYRVTEAKAREVLKGWGAKLK